jgi:chitinase
MKTEPTEALRLIEYSWYALPNATAIDRKDCIKAVNIAFKEGQSNPKIKQLEWVKYNNELYRSKSMSVFFSYEIEKLSADWRLKVLLCQREYDILDKFNFLDEAKAFAQKDFEARIKKCLISE